MFEHLKKLVDPELEIKPEVTIDKPRILNIAKDEGMYLKEGDVNQLIDSIRDYFSMFKIAVFGSTSGKYLIFRKGIEEIIQKSITVYEIGIKMDITGPKEFVDIYDSFFRGIGSALYATKVFPELKDLIFHMLVSENEDIFKEVKGILDEQEKYV